MISLYAGNPLALKLVSQYIVEVFHGEIAAFLREGAIIFIDIQDVLDQQFERLSPLEQEILYWLAIEREAVTLHTLHENLVHPVPRKELLEVTQVIGAKAPDRIHRSWLRPAKRGDGISDGSTD